jgi:hypothetical protein
VSDATLVQPRLRAPDLEPDGAGVTRPTGGVTTGWLVITLVVASAAFGWVLARHPMWFDEMQAWNIARSSGSLGDLLTNLRYEGHPVAWYLPLYAVSRFTGDPRAMQVVEFVVVVSTFALILFRSPFPYLYRLGLVASYFVFFEYGTMSRSYSLAVLVLVALLCVLGRDDPKWTWAAVLSCVLSFTVLSAAVLALALAGALLLERPRDRARRWYAVATVLAAGVSAASCIPPDDFRTFAQGLGNTSQFGSGGSVRVLSSLAGFWRAAVPLPDGSGAWNSNLFDRATAPAVLQAAAGIVVFVLILRVLAGARTAQRIWCIGAAGCLAFSLIVILPERYRYAGTAFLLLVACAWLAWRVVTPRRPLAIAFGVVLVLQVVATVAIVPLAASSRFSPDRGFADAIRRSASGAAIVSGADFDALTAAGYLDQPVYSVARGAWTRYFVHDARQAQGADRLRQVDVLCQASARAERTDRSVVAFVVLRRVPVGARTLARAHGVKVLLVGPDDDLCPA